MEPMLPADEKNLLLRLRDGDHDAFDTLYNRYAHRVAAILLRLTRSQDTAEDLLQDTFIRVWAARQTIKIDHAFIAFVFTIAANLASNSLRKQLREARMQTQLCTQGSVGYVHIEEKVVAQEEYDQFQQALSQLEPRQRQVFVLHKIEGKSYKEISKELAISHSAINHLIQRANKKLETLLNPKLLSTLALLSALLHR
ncbi:RNA polymerase sigma factor [Parapedobacter indicus]|uniref:RNA polymerase sigma-70 factor, ECF subfamily n=1 Tax=Parapedobacter indicus TaxID=1477437 RepID=A0A1I3FQC9_9SPHI|nr:RNA polymerase sigma factor [Parapedobacter indicus]PPL03838.1 RNA polymerase sigma-70 factor (ECF subfamily) [Parapedobacter indicus]SFI13443.1 RNA polymerase sigma-70 factor, ECF subfamily [Parapedobacter indicus]